MKRSGCDIAAASLVTEIEDVLDAMIVSARTSASTALDLLVEHEND
jgi:hypothetical protein